MSRRLLENGDELLIEDEASFRLLEDGASGTTHNRTATITGDGTVAATGVHVAPRTATVTGDGTVAATGLRVVSRTATITGDGTIDATGLLQDAFPDTLGTWNELAALGTHNETAALGTWNELAALGTWS